MSDRVNLAQRLTEEMGIKIDKGKEKILTDWEGTK